MRIDLWAGVISFGILCFAIGYATGENSGISRGVRIGVLQGVAAGRNMQIIDDAKSKFDKAMKEKSK